MKRTLLLFILSFVLLGSSSFAQSPLSGTAQTAFTLVDKGVAVPTTDGAGASIGVGYGSILINSGSVVPGGVAVLGFRINGTLISEVGIPISPLIASGRLYAEVRGQIDTGVAMANPSNQAATISFFFTNDSGVDFGAGTFVLPPYGQISKFLDQDPFNGGGNIQGAFSFTSTVPISVIALRGVLNERSEFLMSSLPVADTSLSAGSTSVILPHFADGAGWKTQIILVNTTDSAISGSIRLVSQDGKPLDTFPFTVPRRSSFKQLTPGTDAVVRAGSVQIAPNAGSTAPVSVAIFSYKPAGVTISEAAVGPASGTALRMYAEASGPPGSALSTQSGVAVTNLSSNPAIVTFEQSAPDGSPTANASLSIPGNGQIADFLSHIFASQNLQFPLQGVLRITAPEPGVSVVGLRGRYNERGEFLITTTPPANEGAPTSAISTYLFPEVANGGGYTTQFLLFGKSAGQPTTGRIVLSNQDGTLPLSLNCPALQGGTGSTFPEVLRRILPEYTDEARLAKISGVVIMQGVVHEDGSLSFSKFIQTVGYGLDENSRNAIEQWRFCPGTNNGRAVAINVTITVSFSIL